MYIFSWKNTDRNQKKFRIFRIFPFYSVFDHLRFLARQLAWMLPQCLRGVGMTQRQPQDTKVTRRSLAWPFLASIHTHITNIICWGFCRGSAFLIQFWAVELPQIIRCAWVPQMTHMDSPWSPWCPGVVPGSYQLHGGTGEAFRRAAWPGIANNQKLKKTEKSGKI